MFLTIRPTNGSSSLGLRNNDAGDGLVPVGAIEEKVGENPMPRFMLDQCNLKQVGNVVGSVGAPSTTTAAAAATASARKVLDACSSHT